MNRQNRIGHGQSRQQKMEADENARKKGVGNLCVLVPTDTRRSVVSRLSAILSARLVAREFRSEGLAERDVIEIVFEQHALDVRRAYRDGYVTGQRRSNFPTGPGGMRMAA